MSQTAVDAKICFDLQREVKSCLACLIMLLNLNSSGNTTLYLTGLLTSAVHYFPGKYYDKILRGINTADMSTFGSELKFAFRFYTPNTVGYEACCSGRLQTNLDHLSIHNTCQNHNTRVFAFLLYRTTGAIASNWSFDFEIRPGHQPAMGSLLEARSKVQGRNVWGSTMIMLKNNSEYICTLYLYTHLQAHMGNMSAHIMPMHV